MNANDYTRAEVPGILRSIYAYHTQSRGWSDIGYNFLVDRFGRIWEGRYGGVDRPVVGAHTLGYNDYSFAMSAIGNFDIKQPSQAMIQAYGALFAWKLSLHGVDAVLDPAVGRLDVLPGDQRPPRRRPRPPARASTSTPRSREIRELAAAAQRGWAGPRARVRPRRPRRTPTSSCAGPATARRFVIPTGGLTGFGRPVAGRDRRRARDRGRRLARPDRRRRRRPPGPRRPTAAPRVRPGNGAGGFGAAVQHDRRVRRPRPGHRRRRPQRRRPQRPGRRAAPATGRLDVYLGSGDGSFAAGALRRRLGRLRPARRRPATSTATATPTCWPATRPAHLWLLPGTGAGRLRRRRPVPGSLGRLRHDHRLRRLHRRRPRRPLRPRARRGAAYVLPGRAATAPSATRSARSPGSRARRPSSARRRWPATRRPTWWRATAASSLTLPEHRHLRARHADRRPASTSPAPNLVLNAGDWDRDGYGDIVTRSTSNGDAVPAPRRRHAATSREPVQARHRLRRGPAAGRGRRHDRRRLPRPDGPAAPAASMRIYPGNGAARAASRATSPTARSTPAARSRSAAGTPTAPPTACSARARS